MSVSFLLNHVAGFCIADVQHIMELVMDERARLTAMVKAAG